MVLTAKAKIPQATKVTQIQNIFSVIVTGDISPYPIVDIDIMTKYKEYKYYMLQVSVSIEEASNHELSCSYSYLDIVK